MKKFSLFTLVLFSMNLLMVKAQTNQWNVLIGVSSTLSLAGTGSELMSIGYSSSKFKSDADGFEESDPDKALSLNFLPKVGVFVANNLAVGLDLNIAFSNEKDGDDRYESNSTLFSAGPFVRYYLPTKKVKPFFEVNGAFGLAKYKYKSDNFDDETTSGILAIGGGVGLAVPLGKKVTFDALAGYNSLTVRATEDNEDNDRNKIGTLGLKLGFTFILGSN